MFSAKVLFLFGCMVVIANAMPNESHVLGGVKQLSGDDLKAAQDSLDYSLKKLAAGDGPHYKIAKVHSASSQVVSGSLTKLDADLIDKNNVTKICNVSIWSQPWLDNGNEVTFKCGDEPAVVKKHGA